MTVGHPQPPTAFATGLGDSTSEAYRVAMREKRDRRRRSTARTGEAIDIDLGASARQIGLFETANGMPHGLAAILVAFGAALLLLPARAIWRALSGRGDDRS